MEEVKFDSRKLKEVAGCFPTGVCVVSVFRSDGSVQGMTASSFLSVSLSPALVLFSVVKNNQMASHLDVGMPLGISILTDQMTPVSNHFAKIEPMDNPPSFVTKSAAPVLENVHAWYATKIQQLIPAGDHYLVLCAVNDLEAETSRAPLVYYQGYKKINPT